MKRILILLIRGYQVCISPLLGNNCRFSPSCSAYTIKAIEVHGSIKGLLLGIMRIARCHPFGSCGVDPVPAKGKWKSTPQEKKEFQDSKCNHQNSDNKQ